MSKKTIFKKSNPSKLFHAQFLGKSKEEIFDTVTNYQFLLTINIDVWDEAYKKLNYDISNPAKFESFLRKMFRNYVESNKV